MCKSLIVLLNNAHFVAYLIIILQVLFSQIGMLLFILPDRSFLVQRVLFIFFLPFLFFLYTLSRVHILEYFWFFELINEKFLSCYKQNYIHSWFNYRASGEFISNQDKTEHKCTKQARVIFR